MREIKFRGKRERKWTFGYYAYNEKSDKHYIQDGTGSTYLVSAETVGQYTGLTDSNGVDIYEGDIIRQRNFNGEEYEAIYVVVWDDVGFCLNMIHGNKKAMELYNSDFEEAEKNNLRLSSFGHHENGKLRKGEVIGNIHDNTELLKTCPYECGEDKCGDCKEEI